MNTVIFPSALAVILILSGHATAASGVSVFLHDPNGNLTQITATSAAAKPAILSQPADWIGMPGSTAVFAVRTTVNSANAYQWKKGTSIIPGATSESLALVNVSAADEAH